MNRRELLQALLVLPGATLLSSCQTSPQNQKPSSEYEGKSENPAILKVILQGPFAVVMQRDERRKIRRIIAFVPMDPAHEFRFQMPTPSYVQKTAPQYQFVLPPEGLEITSAPPYIDHGFDDLNLDLGEWQPNPKEYFVSIELPVPQLITFIPPAEPVVFQDGKLGYAPLNHILEYKVRDIGKVRLRSPQFKEEQKPLAFSEMYRGYEEHWDKERDYRDGPAHGPQQSHTRDDLARPSERDVYTYFFGVGLPPGKFPLATVIQHALEFFNKKLLPQFPRSPAQCCKHLKEIRDYGQPCTPFSYGSPAKIKPTVLRNSMQKPHLQLVASVEECRAPGLLGTSP